MSERAKHGAAALTGLVLGLLALGPGLARGFLLSYDMVFVPRQPLNALTFGLTGTLPRHVPSDAFAALLSTVLPGDLVQKAVLLLIFVLGCAGAAALVPTPRLLPRLAAGICYVWNPYVAERLVLGHWALLLGYASLPWAVAAAGRLATRQAVRALVPAAIGGFAAMAVAGLPTIAVAGFAPGRRRRAVAGIALGVVGLCLPWLVTGWLRPSGVPGAPSAVDAFAPRADTPFGTLGSLLLTGGVWNAEVVPKGYGSGLLVLCWALVVIASLAAFAGRMRRDRPDWAAGLVVSAAVGFLIAAFGVVGAPALKRLIEFWSGFAVIRDGQQYTAPLVLVIAIGLGLAADVLLRLVRPREEGKADWTTGLVGFVVAVLPLVLMPGLADGAAGRLRPVGYPDGWDAARKIVHADRVPGDVLVLPWATYRGYPWNGGRTSLDALPRYLDRRVVTRDAVVVGSTTVPAEDPVARGLDPAVASGGPLVPALKAAGVRYVALDAETGAGSAQRARLAGAETVLDTPDLVLYRIPDPARTSEPKAPLIPAALSWIVMVSLIVWSFVTPGTSVTRHIPRTPRRGRYP
ncbi:hypothetical protein [Actinomadura rupiterrae]|uniref:hypothetical protein n=1 Tax=Actinomadura rupiterrae TaxID=559627 RepID=UPI0020A26122|nr:hypothetical protein [Actinomadura rupiterrae]MCP2335145.1 hypothetical protein [Actinomadura rupiterrae]